MKYRYPYRTSGRTITELTREWFLKKGLQIELDDGESVRLSWCGLNAVHVDETCYKACRVKLEDWVVRELIERDSANYVGQITVLRDRDGLRAVAPTLAKVFDPKTMDIRRRYLAFTSSYSTRV